MINDSVINGITCSAEELMNCTFDSFAFSAKYFAARMRPVGINTDNSLAARCRCQG